MIQIFKIIHNLNTSGKVVVSGGNCKCWEYDEEIRRGVRYVVPEESVWFAGGEI